MRRRFKPKPKKPFYNVNHRINAPSLRVIDSQGKQLGILSRDQALKKAFSLRLDLVEIAPKARPPVAKIIDFKKFLYLEEKKKRKAGKQTKGGETKEIWLAPFMAEHDFASRLKRGKELLKESGKLKIVVKFKGRQITKKNFGFEMLNKFTSSLANAKTEREPRFEGRNLVAIVSKK